MLKAGSGNGAVVCFAIADADRFSHHRTRKAFPRLRMRGHPKKGRSFFAREAHEIRLHREAPEYLAGVEWLCDAQGMVCLSAWLNRVAQLAASVEFFSR